MHNAYISRSVEELLLLPQIGFSVIGSGCLYSIYEDFDEGVTIATSRLDKAIINYREYDFSGLSFDTKENALKFLLHTLTERGIIWGR